MEKAKADCSFRKSYYPGRKRTRRRSHTRKSPLSSTWIDMAEARREIVNALHLHRSSSSPAVPNSASYHRQLTDSMPAPEPTWSTTAPAVLSCAVPPAEVLEVEWFDNLSSSSSSSAWWMGFLSSLDGKIDGGDEMMRGGAEQGLGACLDGQAASVEKSGCTDGIDVDQSLFMEDWLIFPAAAAPEECGDQL